MAVRSCRGKNRRNLHLLRGPQSGAGSFRKNSQGRWRQNRYHGRVSFDVAIAASDDHRARASAIRYLLARRPDQDGQPRVAQALRQGVHGADLRVRDAWRPERVSRSPGNRRCRRHHAGSLLVRRRLRSQEDRRHGRSLASSNCASRLHRSGRAGRFDPPCAQRAERLGSGERARLLPHLVSRPRDRPAGSQRRSDLGRPPAGARSRTPPGSRQAI